MWSGIPISNLQFVVIHRVKGFSIVRETEVIFLEFPCFLYDPMDLSPVCTSGSSSWSTKESEMQYLDAISKMTE